MQMWTARTGNRKSQSTRGFQIRKGRGPAPRPAGQRAFPHPLPHRLPPSAKAAVDTDPHPAQDSGSQASVTCPPTKKVGETDPDPIPPSPTSREPHGALSWTGSESVRQH